jgi:hypothetical protein
VFLWPNTAKHVLAEFPAILHRKKELGRWRCHFFL